MLPAATWNSERTLVVARQAHMRRGGNSQPALTISQYNAFGLRFPPSTSCERELLPTFSFSVFQRYLQRSSLYRSRLSRSCSDTITSSSVSPIVYARMLIRSQAVNSELIFPFPSVYLAFCSRKGSTNQTVLKVCSIFEAMTT